METGSCDAGRMAGGLRSSSLLFSGLEGLLSLTSEFFNEACEFYSMAFTSEEEDEVGDKVSATLLSPSTRFPEVSSCRLPSLYMCVARVTRHGVFPGSVLLVLLQAELASASLSSALFPGTLSSPCLVFPLPSACLFSSQILFPSFFLFVLQLKVAR